MFQRPGMTLWTLMYTIGGGQVHGKNFTCLRCFGFNDLIDTWLAKLLITAGDCNKVNQWDCLCAYGTNALVIFFFFFFFFFLARQAEAWNIKCCTYRVRWNSSCSHIAVVSARWSWGEVQNFVAVFRCERRHTVCGCKKIMRTEYFLFKKCVQGRQQHCAEDCWQRWRRRFYSQPNALAQQYNNCEINWAQLAKLIN